ncbi:hypothetical protein DFQ27_000639 [Actinomortierella ambigua]|uniref:Uncharacterized protein n=1 Tax=Actinomortierella ambigua TaxID=1343610 RepID=A0A9P6U9U2_9FUNG|nr:hypothetical protein DFQ27_000639 [Actinomortierella ambigua]
MVVPIHISASPSLQSSPAANGHSQQRSASAMSSHHLNPNPSPLYPYASSISPPGSASRPASPAASITSTAITIQTPPQSPTAFQLKAFASSISVPSTPPIPSTSSGAGTPGLTSPSATSYFPSTTVGISSNSSISSGSAPSSPSFPPSPHLSLAELLWQPVTRAVLALTVLMTLISLGGRFPEHCTAPSHVLYSHEFMSLIASPFIVPLTPGLLASARTSLGGALLLASSNILSLALFEESLTNVFNGSTIFRNLFVILLGVVMFLRQVAGFVFSRAVGFHLPMLLFSDVMYECNLGLAPYLFALLLVQCLFSDSLWYGADRLPHWMRRKSTVQIVLCLLNVLPKGLAWWAGIGLCVGALAALAISWQRRAGRWGGKVKSSTFEKHMWETVEYHEVDDDVVFPGDDAGLLRERTAGWSLVKTIFHLLPFFAFTMAVVLGFNYVHQLSPVVPTGVINSSIDPQSPYLLTMVLMTAPRRNGAVYIKETLNSYLRNFPEDPRDDPLYSRIQIYVYTHFANFPGYDDAMAHFKADPKARRYVRWMRGTGDKPNQRLHLVSAIRAIGLQEETTYLGIMEDDFPFCDDGWQMMLQSLYKAQQVDKDHCAVFVGTGGSGMLLKRAVALTASFILEGDVEQVKRGVSPSLVAPPDVALQNCIMGNHDFCTSCRGTLVTSKTLAQRHLGYNSSTSGDGYKREEFQCGWRQHFVSR